MVSEDLKKLLDETEVLGKPMNVDGENTVIPVSRVSYGYVGGAGEMPVKREKEGKGGATANGFGMTVTPLGVLVFGDKTTYIKIDESYGEDKWLGLVKSAINAFQK